MCGGAEVESGRGEVRMALKAGVWVGVDVDTGLTTGVVRNWILAIAQSINGL